MIGYQLERYGELAEGIERVLISKQEIETRIYALGEEISRDYAGRNPLLVGVLKGVVPFMADLVRAITIPIEVDYMDIARFQAGSEGAVRLEKDLNVPIEGRHILFVEMVKSQLGMVQQPFAFNAHQLLVPPADRAEHETARWGILQPEYDGIG